MSGGGGGKLLWLATSLATGAGAATGVAALTGFSGTAGFLLATGNNLAASGLVLMGLTATFTTGLATTLALTLAGETGALGAALALILDVGLIVAFSAALAWTGFLGTGLAAAWAAGFFTATLDLVTGFVIFFGAGLAAALALGGFFNGALTGTLKDALGFAAALPPASLAAVLTLLAGLLALAEFAGFAFTACLLWEAASG